jgi:hypothetical protein
MCKFAVGYRFHALAWLITFFALLPAVGRAGVYSYAYGGTVNSGTTDTLGLFGPAGGNLGGQPFNVTLYFDNTGGSEANLVSGISTAEGVVGGNAIGAPTPIFYITITINGITLPVGIAAPGIVTVELCGALPHCTNLSPEKASNLNVLFDGSSLGSLQMYAPTATITPTMTSITETGTFTISGGSGAVGVLTPGGSSSETLNVTPTSLSVGHLLDRGIPAVINVPAVQSGYFGSTGETYIVGSVTGNPIFVVLPAGCYSTSDAFGSGQSGVQYDALNYHNSAANDWAWQYRTVDPYTGATYSYVAAPDNETPATMYASESEAAIAGEQTGPGSFCLSSEQAVDLLIDDTYLPDNTGGVSLTIGPGTAAGDAPLPWWSLAALGAALFAFVGCRGKNRRRSA